MKTINQFINESLSTQKAKEIAKSILYMAIENRFFSEADADIEDKKVYNNYVNILVSALKQSDDPNEIFELSRSIWIEDDYDGDDEAIKDEVLQYINYGLN